MAAVTLWDKMAKVGGGISVPFLSTRPVPAYRRETLSGLVPEMRQLANRGTGQTHPVDIVHGEYPSGPATSDGWSASASHENRGGMHDSSATDPVAWTSASYVEPSQATPFGVWFSTCEECPSRSAGEECC